MNMYNRSGQVLCEIGSVSSSSVPEIRSWLLANWDHWAEHCCISCISSVFLTAVFLKPFMQRKGWGFWQDTSGGCMEENHSPLVIQIAKQYSPTFRVLALHGSWASLLTGVKWTDWRDEKCVEILFLFLVIQTV